MKLGLVAVLAIATLALPLGAQAHNTTWGITKTGAEQSLYKWGIEFSDGYWEIERVTCRGEMRGAFISKVNGRWVRYFKHLWCAFSAWDADEACDVIGTLRYHVTGRNSRLDETVIHERGLEWFC